MTSNITKLRREEAPLAEPIGIIRLYPDEVPEGYSTASMFATAAAIGAVFYGLPLWLLAWLFL